MGRIESVRVLLVEDEQDLLSLLVSELEIEGFQVEAFEGAFDAYQAFLQKDFDVIVSDLRMNNGSGTDLLKKVRADANPQKASTPFILMSGFSEHEEQEVLSMGAQKLLHKPFRLGDFIMAIKSVLRA